MRVPELDRGLVTDSGVFSNDRIDPGTGVLLRVAPPPPPKGNVLDLGCGYGPIAVTLALRAPDVTVWGVDVNRRALGLLKQNAERYALANVVAATSEEVPSDLRFDAIYSNPPVRVGKEAMRSLLLGWLARLVPSGHAYLVVKRNLGADSLAEWLTGQGFPTTRLRSKQGYRVLDTENAAGGNVHDAS